MELTLCRCAILGEREFALVAVLDDVLLRAGSGVERDDCFPFTYRAPTAEAGDDLLLAIADGPGVLAAYHLPAARDLYITLPHLGAAIATPAFD